MTRARVAQILYTAVYFVVRRAPPLPSLEEFLDTRIKSVFADPAPSDWPTFWRETVTVVLEDLFRREGLRIDGLTPEFFENRNRKMLSIRDRIAAAVMPIAEPETATGAQRAAEKASGAASARRAAGKARSAGSGKASGAASGRAPASTRPPRGAAGAASAPRETSASAGRRRAARRPGGRIPPALRLAILLPALACAHGGLGATASAAAASAGSTAFLERTPADRAGEAGDRYDIVVLFGDKEGRPVEVPVDLAGQPARYELRSSCGPGQPLAVRRAVWRGVGEREGHSLGAVLHAPLDPACTYTLWVRLPGVSTGRVKVAPLDPGAAPAEGFVRFVRFVDRHASGTLDLRTLEGESDKVGVDVQAQLSVPVARERLGADAIRCGLAVDGMLAVRKSPRRVHNALDADLRCSWLRTYSLPGPTRGGRHVHAFGFQLSPAGIESDQDARWVDFTAGPAATFSIPFLDWPLLLWHRLIEMPRGFLPPTARVGYKRIHRVRARDGSTWDRRRVDLELVAVAPLLRPLDVLLRHRVFHDLEDRSRRSNVEVAWRWYVDRDTRTAVLIKLVHGALPPLFERAEVASLGFQIGL
ncbi:MAG: hypothetical protein FJY75_09215 [Candidatus Eisenbacteria bacterium]|uniref:Uncharacterized protein n=1 Tax=Eiseniibacteriota bacterium TaxID=2212470 RepID=A0A938BR79_UNCEI|nr:hypothetical protein [Candidatus Eisenbacteria bacterium]